MGLLFCESLQIPLGGGVFLRLEDEATGAPSSSPVHRAMIGLPEGWTAIESNRKIEALSPKNRPPILYDPLAADRGIHNLRVFELRDYAWEVVGSGSVARAPVLVTSSLQQSIARDQWRARESHGRFRFINYLGSAWIEATAPGQPPVRISFEVASPKLDYETEYRSMIEAIGAECQQLLLEWGTPAAVNVALDTDKHTQTLLEQFLFVRHVLGPDKLELFLETISRHSHSRLTREIEWKPGGTTDARYLAGDPMRRGRDWRLTPRGNMPSEMQDERKFESSDTPPNQFVKFALKAFRELCVAVTNATRNGKPAFEQDAAVSIEVSSMLQTLDVLLSHPLFDDVSELRRVPFESTTLQRRDGYREIFTAWLMLEVAAALDWPGREDAYDGTTRDVATLYEYWLYFLIVRAFRENLGMLAERDPLEKIDGALPFCCYADDGRLVINLREREASFSRFRWVKDGQALRVHFFYNRSFGRTSVERRGSYSKTFRPDFSLVIIPEEYGEANWSVAEKNAEKDGRIAYLHFDAKYRGENLPGLFGNAESEADEPEDAQSKASGTVKRVDLYKMHTYNEAIRRTVGSYVLYPGTDASPDQQPRFERYHEILPGIGAFAVRPGTPGSSPSGLGAVCDFIRDVFVHQSNKFTQSYKISSATEDIIRTKPQRIRNPDAVEETVSLPAAAAVLGYMRKADIERFRNDQIFYCRATDEDGVPLALDLSVAQGAVFIGWTGPHTGPFVTTSWLARIVSCRLVTADTIERETAWRPMSASVHYLLFKLADLSTFRARDITNIVATNNSIKAGSKFRTFQTDVSTLYSERVSR